MAFSAPALPADRGRAVADRIGLFECMALALEAGWPP